jgi:hypothetical protein
VKRSVYIARLHRLCEAQNWRCAYCHVRFWAWLPFPLKGRFPWTPDWTRPTVDHVVSRWHGGPVGWINSVAACYRCNQLKGTESAESFLLRRGWIRSARDRAADRDGYLDAWIRRFGDCRDQWERRKKKALPLGRHLRRAA